MNRIEEFKGLFCNNNIYDGYELIEYIGNYQFRLKHLLCGTIFIINLYNFLNGSRCHNKECMKNKVKETSMKNFGVEHPMKSKEVQDKIKNIFIKKLGVDNPLKSPKIQEKIQKNNLKKYGYKSPFSSSIIKERIKKTNKERYGSENPFGSTIIKEKIKEKKNIYYANNKNSKRNKFIGLFKNGIFEDYQLMKKMSGPQYILKHLSCNHEFEMSYFSFLNGQRCPNNKCRTERSKITNLKRHGVEYISQSNIVKNKVKKTNLERFGFESPTQSPAIKEKTKLTNIKNNGVPYPLMSIKIKEKSELTNLERYGDKNPAKTKAVKEKMKQTNLKRYGKNAPTQSDIIKEKVKNTFYKKNYKKILSLDSVIPLFDFNQYKGVGNYQKYKWQCKKCGNIFEDHFHSRLPRCLKCHPLMNGFSNIENEIKDWLKQYINVNKKKFDRKYEIDVYNEDKKIGIELNGVYWHSEIGGNKNKNYHLDKTNFFKEKGIQLLHIFDNEWIEKQEIVKSLILSKFGLIENKIYARKCIIKKLKSNEVEQFYDKNHLQGFINSSVNIGLFYQDKLVSCLSLSKPRFNKNYDYEITRFASLVNTQVIGGFSKLLTYFMHNYNKQNNFINSTKELKIITYADKRFSTGNLYLQNGFKLIGESQPNYYYTKNYIDLEPREKYQKHKLSKIIDKFDNTLTEWENMQLNEYDRIWDCGNYLFELKR